MKTKKLAQTAITLIAITFACAWSALAPRAFGAGLGTSFTHQCDLKQNGNPANGTFNFQYRLFDDLGNEMAPPVDLPVAQVAGGRCQNKVDFGNNIRSEKELWLEVRVNSTVMPRVKFSPATQAQYAAKAGDADLLAGLDSSRLWQRGGNPVLNPGNPGDNVIGLLGNGPLELIGSGVGINKTPTVALDVEGDIKFSGALIGGITVTDGSITVNKLADGAVTTLKLANGATTTDKVTDGAIVASKLGDGAVTALKLSDNAVTAAKVASGQVVKSLNGLFDNVTLAAGANATITPSGNSLLIACPGAVGPYWALLGNGGTDPAVNFLGTTDNTNLVIRVNNETAMRYFPKSLPGGPNLVGGIAANFISPGAGGSVIAGGGIPSLPNQVWNDHSFVGGGYGNVLFGRESVIAGGQENTNAGINSLYTVISGGHLNWINEDCHSSVIAGGEQNVIDGGLASQGQGQGGGTPYNTIGGGFQNRIVLPINNQRDGNTIAGGYQNQILQSVGNTHIRFAFVGGGYGNTNLCDAGVMGGGSFNRIEGGDGAFGGSGSFIGSGSGNQITRAGDHIAIVAGRNNQITVSATSAFIGAGVGNAIGDVGSTSDASVIGGGFENRIFGAGAKSFIGGGQNNTNAAQYGVIGGGILNQIGLGAAAAMIPGGNQNFVGENCYYSFAAGNRAKALHRYSFVWADGWPFDFASTFDNQFSVRATGGVRFVSAIDGGGAPTAGVELAIGSGSWSALSDRNAKENLQPVDSRVWLEKVVALPLGTWNYKSQDKSIRHVGPMAQDFHAAFGVGEDERHITSVDADGVALAAIQGLNEIVKEKDARMKALETRLEKLEELLASQAAQKGRDDR